jgi:hypothetical protein
VFVIEAYDEEGNRRLSGGDEFLCVLQKQRAAAEVGEVALLPDSPGAGGDTGGEAAPPSPADAADSVWASLEDGGDGSYVVRYTPPEVGSFQLFVLIGDSEPVAASPYVVRVGPGAPSPAACELCGEGRRRAVQGERAEFYVQARDRLGHSCEGEVDLPLEVSLSDGSGAVLVRCEPAGGGRVLCAYSAPRPGYYRLTVSSSGAPVGQSPYSVRVWGTAEEAEASPAKGAAAAEGPEEGARAPPDQAAVWEGLARMEFAADGCDDGWDSEPEVQETEEERYIKENPDVPVVEHLEDIWKVGKWQREAAALERKEKEKRLRRLRARFEREFGDLGASPLAPGAPLPAALAGLAALD